jgi:predicted nucleotide-binding protein (sugar kinase/HSP70/actin superfamily)
MKSLKKVKYIDSFIGLHDKKEFTPHFSAIMKENGYKFPAKDISAAASKAYAEYESHMSKLRQKANEFLDIAKKESLPVIVLCGRPYHIDPEISHGLSGIICGLGAVVVTEDSVSVKTEKFKTSVLNQWTYHSRLYAAARFVAENDDMNMNLVHLVSFGCGVDAVTSDETRAILEHKGKIYTQIKIDEISNIGAVRIRLRSLFAVMKKARSSKKKIETVVIPTEEKLPVLN